MAKFFITGIGTGVGKTLVSAIFTEAFNADYWKPVQAGTEDGTDAQSVKDLITNKQSRFIPEAYLLQTPASPHFAAAKGNVLITEQHLLSCFRSVSSENLVIEGAGGLMVPLNTDFLIVDFILSIGFPVVLVCNYYLGSINHTLLSVDALRSRNIQIEGLVFSGNTNPSTRQVILDRTKLPVLLEVPQLATVTSSVVKEFAEILKNSYAQKA